MRNSEKKRTLKSVVLYPWDKPYAEPTCFRARLLLNVSDFTPGIGVGRRKASTERIAHRWGLSGREVAGHTLTFRLFLGLCVIRFMDHGQAQCLIAIPAGARVLSGSEDI
jgi:hypothetical protein